MKFNNYWKRLNWYDGYRFNNGMYPLYAKIRDHLEDLNSLEGLFFGHEI